MTGKVALITGANAGIGKRAAHQLAELGARVIIVCRNRKSGEDAVEEIKSRTRNSQVAMIQADLSLQKSVRQLAETVKTHFERLDVLIHNAANFDLSLKRPLLTEDRVEQIFATNHLGPFLLTHLLLDLMKKSAPSRIITIASKGLLAYPRLTVDLDNLNGERKFSPTRAYYQSKLAQLMFTYDLAESLKDSGVTVNSIRVPSVKVDEGRHEHLPAWMRWSYRMKRKFAMEPEKMAETYVRLAADPDLERTTGAYFDEHMRTVSSSKASYNRASWNRLRDISERLTGMKS